ncbi:ATP synthase F1 subunit epsilon [Buchnera aphidicola]|uniref:ATP synthase F1 subunit epsilon n=1 Tax=Buchnera aphidicola TaxID=9 RepID=UPI0022381E82|nr:ATP synthase F1 subunit epsilon [Buchnera aphidicola]MCW5197414.1 ATP synthase F1 subunit epsilon [Buchnera aphidicola (Chaitophorus viminalis)]
MSLNLNILSLKKKLFSKKIKSVSVPGEKGYFSIFRNHISLLTFLKSGLIIIKKKNKKTEYFFILKGILEIQKNVINILTNHAINVKYLDKSILIDQKNKIENKYKNFKNIRSLNIIKKKYFIILDKLNCITKVQKIQNK